MGEHDDTGAHEALEAWRELCRGLERLGERLFDDDFPSPGPDRVEGLSHLATQALCWIGWSVAHADPRRPMFHRQNDLFTPWGGPNADNVYRHARVAPGRTYVIRGRMHACEDFILAVRAGFMHEPKWGTLHEVTASELGIGPGDDFEVAVGGPPAGERWVPLPDDAAMVSVREYYFDWQADEPAVFTIECTDGDAGAPAGRLEGGELATRFAAAAAGTAHSIEYWNRYLREHRAEGRDNAFAPPMKLAKGLATARYAFCFWELGPDDALVVDTDVPDARYWGFQLYTLGWFELVDPLERQTSLGHRQAVVDPDGRVRVVLAHRDPGVANWLDTGGRPAGLLTLRWFWPRSDPSPVATRVALSEVASVLPATTAATAPAARAEALGRRRRHLAWRFRT